MKFIKLYAGLLAALTLLILASSKSSLRDTLFGVAVAAIVLPILMALGGALFRLLVPAPGRAMHCTRCGHQGPTALHTKGALWLEALPWLLLILPGLVYSIWRHRSRHVACAHCGSVDLIPIDSPYARAPIHPAPGNPA